MDNSKLPYDQDLKMRVIEMAINPPIIDLAGQRADRSMIEKTIDAGINHRSDFMRILEIKPVVDNDKGISP